MKTILSLLARIASVIYSYSLSTCLKWYKNIIYTSWIKSRLDAVGHSTIIEKPCQLQGGCSAITIGRRSIIQAHSVLGCWKEHNGTSFNPHISIGDDCSLGEYNHLTAIKGITIGNGLLTGRFVLICDNDHGELSFDNADIPPGQRLLQSKGEIVIGNNCWIGDKATILGGVHIGNNVIIAANSVVTHDIPDNCLVAGVPAKAIKRLDL